jgi:hypothetical protein
MIRKQPEVETLLDYLFKRSVLCLFSPQVFHLLPPIQEQQSMTLSSETSTDQMSATTKNYFNFKINNKVTGNFFFL